MITDFVWNEQHQAVHKFNENVFFDGVNAFQLIGERRISPMAYCAFGTDQYNAENNFATFMVEARAAYMALAPGMHDSGVVVKEFNEIDWSKPGVFQVDITPEIAKIILGKNYKNNRGISDYHVAEMANDMKRGAWSSDACEPLKFDKNGTMIDGQHRMYALVRSGKTIRFFIQTGLNTEAYKLLDNGARRSAANLLDVSIPSKTDIAALACRILVFNAGSSSSSLFNNNRIKTSVTRIQIVDYSNKNWKQLIKFVRLGDRILNKYRCGNRTMYSTCLYIIERATGRSLDFVNAMTEDDERYSNIRFLYSTVALQKYKDAMRFGSKLQNSSYAQTFMHLFHCYYNNKLDIKLLKKSDAILDYYLEEARAKPDIISTSDQLIEDATDE